MRRTIQPIEEMAEAMSEQVASGKRTRDIYKVQAEQFKAEQLSADIGRAVYALSQPEAEAERVDLNNAEDVRRRIVDYLRACQLSGTYPSVQGLASFGFGISRQALNQWRQRDKNKGSESAALISRACDMFADILTNQSLHNNANPVQALFQMKNNHGFADKIEIEPIYDTKEENEHKTIEQIRAMYLVDDYGTDDIKKLPDEALSWFDDDELKAAGRTRPAATPEDSEPPALPY